jgi:hypothetical protein
MVGLAGLPSSQDIPFVLEAGGSAAAEINVDYNLDEDPLVNDDDMAEIEEFILSYPELTKDYIPIAVIGEGTHHMCRANTLYHYRYVQHGVQGHRCESLDEGQ